MMASSAGRTQPLRKQPLRKQPLRTQPLRIAVVGGGFTGAVFLIHAAHMAQCPVEFTIVDPRPEAGRGIAYSTEDRDHRINVPTARMSLFPEDPDHATRWFFDTGILPDAGSQDGQGHYYVPRHDFGRYVGAVLQGTIKAAGSRVLVRHRHAVAQDIVRGDHAWSVLLSDGSSLAADRVVLSFGHATPALPCPVSLAAQRDPRFVANPWAAHAFDAVRSPDQVLIVGTGLSMADAVASLLARGHRGRLTAVSRHGLLPLPQGVFRDGIDILGEETAPRTAAGLLGLLRRRVPSDGGALGWQALVDAFRSRLPDFWGNLPVSEKRKVLTRLLPFWDVHRFRIAPQTHSLVQEALNTARLRVERGALVSIDREAGRLVANLRRAREGCQERRMFDAIILCTGPARDPRLNALVASLLDRGLGRLDPIRLGLAVDRCSRLLDSAGTAQPDVFALGPMTRGSFGEMTGAPDITRHVQAIVGLALEP